VSYGGADAVKQPDKPTDDKGETTARIRPGAGHKVTHDSKIFATDVTDLVDVAQVAVVRFEAGTVPTSFFGDAFAPYYDPGGIHVEPLPLIEDRPVTISASLENRGKFPAELAATFTSNDWNIGRTDWKEIGKIGNILLKPGEARVVSIRWTPRAAGHQCFRVDLSGRMLWTTTQSEHAVAASLFPVQTWAQPERTPRSSEEIQGSLQRNLSGVVKWVGDKLAANKISCAPGVVGCTFDPATGHVDLGGGVHVKADGHDVGGVDVKVGFGPEQSPDPHKVLQYDVKVKGNVGPYEGTLVEKSGVVPAPAINKDIDTSPNAYGNTNPRFKQLRQLERMNP